MRRSALIIVFISLFMLASCGGASKSDKTGKGGDANGSATPQAFFPPDQADVLAHQAMPEAAELPGPGWQISKRDEFNDAENTDFDKALASEPACAQLNELGSLGGALGSGSNDQELPAGRAKLEFENAISRTTFPTGVEVTVEIERTVAEVEGSWGIVKDIFEREETQQCFLAAFRIAFADLGEQEGFQANVSTRNVSASAPRDGVTMGVDIHMAGRGIQFDMAVEMYLWPYGNASVTVLFLGVPDAVNVDLIEPTLRAVDARVARVGTTNAPTPAAASPEKS